jgi:hypothetical protein
MTVAPVRRASSASAAGIKPTHQPAFKNHHRRRATETTVRPATKSAIASIGSANTAAGYRSRSSLEAVET